MIQRHCGKDLAAGVASTPGKWFGKSKNGACTGRAPIARGALAAGLVAYTSHDRVEDWEGFF